MSRFFHRSDKGKLVMSRRAMLRGALGGAAALVALPTLEAMLSSHGTALADGTPLPRRLVTWLFGNGVRLNRWVPQGIGADYPLSDELLPLANVREYVSVLSGFKSGLQLQIGHWEGMAIFSCHTSADAFGYQQPIGPTVDQLVAAANAGKTVFPSIELGISKRVTTGDPQIQYLAHKGPGQPLPPEYNPKALWSKLFASYAPMTDPASPRRVSVLDTVREDILAMQGELGSADKQRLEAHLESVGNLQKQIAAVPPACALPGEPLETNVDVAGVEPLSAVNKAMNGLLAYAFTCDITRAASVIFSSAIGSTIFYEAGAKEEHHNLTHGMDQEIVHKAVVFTMGCFAHLLETLKATPDGTGNLLDNSVVFCASDCAEGATHELKDQPMLVAGRGGGALTHPGIHYRSGGENTSDVVLACLKAAVPEATEIGSGVGYSKTPCAALKA
jgi:hypothetical protein